MADRTSLGLVGLVFGCVTLAVMLIATVTVYRNIDGRLALDPGVVVSAATAATAATNTAR